MSDIVVCALYRFVRLPEYVSLQKPLLDTMHALNVRGTLLLAAEGINGTIAGDRAGIDGVLAWLQSHPAFEGVDYKESYTDALPFKRTKVKLKKEIVTMGVTGIDPNHTVGTYVEPEDWNALISDPDVLLIDTRNDYEVEVGTFKNAVNPNTTTFREFPAYVDEHLDAGTHKKVAMFCTGGIRCEKSTALLKEKGFGKVFHLKGGILNYLAKVPEADSHWQGECFVFDDRVTVDHQLERGHYDQCNACRLPITDADKQHPHYVQGVSCPRCYDQTTPERKERFQERERQIQLAKGRGESHLGNEAFQSLDARRAKKREARKAQVVSE